MRFVDISMPLYEGMPSFPGDPPFISEPTARRERGQPYDLSRLAFGSHAGTHVDPPGHFVEGGARVDQLDLGTLNGPCRVVQVPQARRAIGPQELRAVPADTARVLLKTSNSARWARRLAYFEDFVGLTGEGALYLSDRGVRLVGIDALSIEQDASRSFPVHRALLGRGVVILEGLLLDGVAAGDYELRCLPLRLRGGDGGPARAVLGVGAPRDARRAGRKRTG